MIAVDTSSMIAFFTGEDGADVELIVRALASSELVLPPPVLTELITGANAGHVVLLDLTLLEIQPGYWHRTGQSRRLVHNQRLKANLGDSLIAQACIDADVALITRDADFRHFAAHCGLKLA
jgi:predicted nucleic acid-binding protein